MATQTSGATSAIERDELPTDRPSIGGAALAELLGTFFLLFFGVGTIVALGGAAESADKLTIGLAFGFAIVAGVYAFGHVSGAHLNPAVTIALAATRRFPASAVLPYVVAQLLGAVLGVLAVDVLLDQVDVGISATTAGPGVSAGEALIAEVILGFLLLLVIKATAVDDRSESAVAGVAIGLTIAAGHLAMIPVSGASFNPARTLGSAIVGGEFSDVWVYLVGPVLGALAAAFLYDRVLRRVRTPGD